MAVRQRPTRVFLGSDHAGFELKQILGHRLADRGLDVADLGAHSLEPLDDYPSPCFAVGSAVVSTRGSLGVVIGGSGNGEQIAANKVPGVRAVLGWSVATAQQGRAHNNANVVAIGAREHPVAEAVAIVVHFLSTPFSFDPRHARRIRQITSFERVTLGAPQP